MQEQWGVASDESGMSLLAFLKKKRPEYSARFLKKAIENNRCQLNGRVERFASAMIGKGDRIIFSLPVETQKQPLFNSSRILFENEHLLFYDKQDGYASDNPTFLHLIKEKYPYIELLHRLDKDTSGVLLFAKSPVVREAIIEAFKKHLVKKTYYALVDGIPNKTSGIIDNYLGKKRIYEGQTIWGEVHPSKGLHAVTAWEKVNSGKGVSLIKCFPKTGRTHQLRVHLSELGHPILGDFQYGKRFGSNFRPRRHLLHAFEMELEYPAGMLLKIRAPLPMDFVEALQGLKCAF